MYFYVYSYDDKKYFIDFDDVDVNHKNACVYKFKIVFDCLYRMNKDTNNFVYVKVPLNFYYSLYSINEYDVVSVNNTRYLEIDLNLLKKVKTMKLKIIF